MIANRGLGLVAAVATLLAAAPLSAIFQRWTWLVQATIAVAVVAGVAALLRMVRAPLWGQVLGMVAGLLLALTWMFPSGGELAAVLPTPATIAHFGELTSGSVQDMRSYGVKVPDTDPLLFITVLGVGSVAVVVDVLAVGLRRPALAGLPMLAIYSVPVAVYVDSVPPVPFVIGAAGYLWLLVSDNIDRVRRFGRRFTGDGRDVDVWESSPLASAGRRLAVVGVVAAVLLPLAVPGMTGGLLDRLQSSGGTGSGGNGIGGGPGRVDLFAGLKGQLNQNEVADLVKVTTNEPDPFYLRFGVADVLRENGFGVRGPAGRSVTRDLPDPTEGIPAGVRQQQYRATVEVTRTLDMPLMPVYADPVRIQGLGGGWLYDSNQQVVFSNRDNSRGKRYEFDYVRSLYTPELLRRADPLSATDPMVQQFTDTPAAPEVDALVEELISGRDTDYDRVRAIYEHFSVKNGFSYSLRTEGGTSGKDIVDFLTNKVGFCQQYAAAMAWLVRAAGIPARVAFGFTNGTSQDEGSYVLTNRNLHAWTEVYFDDIGWVPFDATPAYGVPGNARPDWAPDNDAPDPVTPVPGTSTAPDATDPSAGPAGPDDPNRNIDEGVLPQTGGPVEQAPVWPWWTVGGLALLVLLAVPALRRLALRRRRGTPVAAAPVTPAVVGPAGPAGAAGRMTVVGADADRARAQAHAAWDELLDTLLDYRVRVDRTETPRATADRLVRETLTGDDPAATAVRLLGRAEERARYARDPMAGGELYPALGAIRRALGARADRRTRIIAATLPPSVLLRWRNTVTDTSTRLVTATGRVRSRLLRWNPRRLLAGRPAR
ncbi:transglutaminase TgpA family protein [Micromonospora cathayae]|uniref:TransglutaminaseTgpA domain-containing protein n=1 Tax=Micromonospora cathayae TaxID=3028804 RepID=A0ABY7ZQK3_9ACTN|nr:transglutaminaseTgpA domain-containing protein [Micromonospora sp. HUAS 3]WDZ84353.1 transglutaminaseTgpA domain-containing protein [Micromonospora sp. HUAS 3]